MGDLRPTLAMPKVIYATHAVELASMGLRKLTKNGRLFLGDEAPTKLLYMVRRKISWRWAMLTPD